MTSNTDLERLGEYLYGKETPSLDFLVQVAADKQLREILKGVEGLLFEEGGLPKVAGSSASRFLNSRW